MKDFRKGNKKSKRNEEVEDPSSKNSDVEVDEFDSEEEAMRGGPRKRDPRNAVDKKNTLKLGQFHRNNISKKKNRKPALKKQIRDVQRLLERPGLPEEIKTVKLAQLKELKKQGKK